MIKTALEKPVEMQAAAAGAAAPREWGLKFQRSPQEVLPSADGKRARGIRMALTCLEVLGGWCGSGRLGWSRTRLHPLGISPKLCVPYLAGVASGRLSGNLVPKELLVPLRFFPKGAFSLILLQNGL